MADHILAETGDIIDSEVSEQLRTETFDDVDTLEVLGQLLAMAPQAPIPRREV